MVWQKGKDAMDSLESAFPEDWWREVDPLAPPDEDPWCFIANQISDGYVLLNKLKKKAIPLVYVESSRLPLFCPALDLGKNRTAKHFVTLTTITPEGPKKQSFPVYKPTEEEKVAVYYNLARRLQTEVERLHPNKNLSPDDLKNWGEYQLAISQLSASVSRWEQGDKREAGRIRTQQMRVLAKLWYAHCYVFYMDGTQKGPAIKTRTTFNDWFEAKMLRFKKQEGMGAFLLNERFSDFFNLLYTTKTIPNFVNTYEYELKRYLSDKGLSNADLRFLVKENPILLCPLPTSVSEVIPK